jgi:hypothetical protein
MKKVLVKVLISLISTLLCFALLEGVTRMIIRRDPDGDLLFRSLRLSPCHPPIVKAATLIDNYEKHLASAKMIYDPDLGWRPAATGSDGNTEDFASTRPEPGRIPRPGCLRIALFGGSYTRGGTGKSWWKVLDQQLSQRRVNAEVLNFGVPGYAMDQAYLRWKKEGAAYHPDLVIFGFSAGNAMDNVNIVRLLQNPDTGIPFTKPRFILDHDALKLINSPTVPPDMLLRHMADLAHWPLLRYDHFYDPESYQRHWWQASRLLALIVAKKEVFSHRIDDRRFYQMDAEPARLALKIVRQFKHDVELSGSKFLVVHLPAANELSDYQAHGSFAYSDLYSQLRESAPVVQTEQNLMAVIGEKDPHSLFDDGHYTDALHASVGTTLAGYIAARWGKDAPGSNK